jgi:hypothetical protein
MAGDIGGNGCIGGMGNNGPAVIMGTKGTKGALEASGGGGGGGGGGGAGIWRGRGKSPGGIKGTPTSCASNESRPQP